MKRTLAFAAALLLAASASAQVGHRCKLPDGTMQYSDRPCAGAAVPAPAPSTAAATTPKAPDNGHLRYMSPRCASLHDALRTAYQRGLTHETVNTMRRDYQAECGENEAEARQQFYREQGADRQARASEKRAEQVASNQARLMAQQCDESKRILIAKRNRPDLNEGERAELKRFEEQYKARCAP